MLVHAHTHTSVNNLMFFFQVVQSLYYLQERGRVKEEVKEKEGRKGKDVDKREGRRRTVCALTETAILHTISSGNGPFSLFCSRSRHVAISSMNTQTSF